MMSLQQILKNIFIILNTGEKRKLRMLSVADVTISILDIVFLLGLLYVINLYTSGTVHAQAIFEKYPLLLTGGFFLLFALKNLAGFVLSKMQFNFVYGVASRLSKDNLTEYLNGSFENYVNVDSSVINRKISQQPIEFCHYVLNGMQQVFSQLILIFITIVAICIVNPVLFPLLLLILAPPVLVISFLLKRKLDAAAKQGKKTSEKALQYLQEALTAYVESNIYIKKEFFINRYHRFQEKLNQYLSDRLAIQSMPSRLIEVFAVFGLFVLLAVQNNSIRVVTIGTLMIAAYKIIPGIVKITNLLGQLRSYAYTTIDIAKTEQSLWTEYLQDEPISSVVFENVSFSYPVKKILNSFSVRLQNGDMLGISGISGKGKTTFVNILLGFLSPASGNILFNDKMTDAAMRQGFWNRIAYIKQESFFLNGSIIENITLEDSDYDDEKIKRVIGLTGLDQLTAEFNDGLKTVVTENGKNFSGGQRQRIIFARALYKDFDLLVLDEPFNELDEDSETEMLMQLQKISAEGKMILLITHNRQALSYCNKKIDMGG